MSMLSAVVSHVLGFLVLSLAVFLALVHYWVVLTFALPYAFVSFTLSFGIKQVQAAIIRSVDARKGTAFSHEFLRHVPRIHAVMFMASSISRGSIVYALCGGAAHFEYYSQSSNASEPTCVLLNAPSESPLKIVGIVCLIYMFYLDLCVTTDMCMFAYPRVRHPIYRALVAWQSSLHFTATTLSMPTLPLYPFAAYFFTKYSSNSKQLSVGNFAPLLFYAMHFGFGLNGLYNSLVTHWTFVKLDFKRQLEYYTTAQATTSAPLLGTDADNIDAKDDSTDSRQVTITRRIHVEKSATREHLSASGDELRIIQIADPHIGSLMTVERLNTMCKEIVAAKPHLVLLTGDFFTGESNIDGLLSAALAPLKPIADCCFACLGNHDMESTIVLRRTCDELRQVGVRLLRQEQAVVSLADFGTVQVFGFDFMNRRNDSRRQTLRRTFLDNPKPDGCRLRVALLHDPSGFSELSGDEQCLVFSGHTHGGHIGLLSCGLRRTAFSMLLPSIPDNGVFANGSNVLYVHRGQGSRALFGNMVLRAGVPTEQSLLFVNC